MSRVIVPSRLVVQVGVSSGPPLLSISAAFAAIVARLYLVRFGISASHTSQNRRPCLFMFHLPIVLAGSYLYPDYGLKHLIVLPVTVLDWIS